MNTISTADSLVPCDLLDAGAQERFFDWYDSLADIEVEHAYRKQIEDRNCRRPRL